MNYRTRLCNFDSSEIFQIYVKYDPSRVNGPNRGETFASNEHGAPPERDALAPPTKNFIRERNLRNNLSFFLDISSI